MVLISAGCITEASQGPARPVDVTPTNTLAVIVNESQPLVKVEVIQASAEDTESEFMFRTKGRYLGESFKIERENVSGEKDLSLDISVYKFKFLRLYHESAADSWGTFKYWTNIAPAGQKFLFAFIRVEMEGTDKSKDPRIWGFEASHFAAQIGNQFAPFDSSRSPCVPIREMQDVFNFNDNERVNDYGKLNTVASLSRAGSGTQCQDLGWLRMGQSNEWDGYLIWIVPESVTEKDIQIVGDFDHFGSAWWRLTWRPL
jgi:hypothetical protein